MSDTDHKREDDLLLRMLARKLTPHKAKAKPERPETPSPEGSRV
jgi:hypothetical protein